MSDIVIHAENLSKLYRIGERLPYKTLTDTITNLFSGPLKKIKNGLKLKERPDEYIWALKDISFEVKRGEVVGIIGRNGSGKSTLLKILSRITIPTEGYAQVQGRISSLLEIGIGFHPELTGRDNIYFNGAILGMRKKEINRKFDEIVAFAEIEKFIDTPVKYYSSGMCVRLAFAVAAHLEPDILLVDEVLAVGDAEFQKKCLGKMDDVAKGGRTVLFVSHNMLAIQSMCKRCILLEEGKVCRDGDADSAVEYYLIQGTGHMPNSIETKDLKRIDDSGNDLRIIKASIHSPNSQARVLAGAPFTIEMEMQVMRTVENIAYGFGIFSLQGICLFRCNNNDNEKKPYPRLEPGRYRVKGAIEKMPLPPGRYYLGIGVLCSKKSLDWLPELMYFEVLESEVVETTWFKTQDGLFRQPSHWDLPQKIA